MRRAARVSANPIGRSEAGENASNQFPAMDPRILRALEVFQQSTPAHLSDVAADLNLSSSRFRHLFRQELGLSPKHYLKLKRLIRARKLLETSFLRIKEVAASVGSNDVSHFVRDYKAFYGQTPSQTRAAYAERAVLHSGDSRYSQ